MGKDKSWKLDNTLKIDDKDLKTPEDVFENQGIKCIIVKQEFD